MFRQDGPCWDGERCCVDTAPTIPLTWMVPPIKPMRRMVGRRRRNMQLIFSMKVKFDFYIHPHRNNIS